MGPHTVLAVVDGHAWETSVWRDTRHGTLLAVPKRVRGAKEDGDIVEVEILPAGSRPSRRRRTLSS